MYKIFSNDFFRIVIFSDLPISGSFKYKDIFQLVNYKSNLKSNNKFENKYPIILEFRTNFFKEFKTANDYGLFKPKQLDTSKELMAILSLIGNSNFFYDSNYINENLKKDINSKSDFYGLNDSNLIDFSNSFINRVIKSRDDIVVFPNNCDLYFNNYFSLTTNRLTKYRMSLMLYYNSYSIKKISPSMSIVALISSIENLMNLESELNKEIFEKCNECNQKRYRVTKRFIHFMISYCEDNSTSFKKYLNKIYSTRSDISHLGNLLYGDYGNTNIDLQGAYQVENLKRYVRIALYNWIIKN